VERTEWAAPDGALRRSRLRGAPKRRFGAAAATRRYSSQRDEFYPMRWRAVQENEVRPKDRTTTISTT
jgi:hypothetical protein